MRTKTECGSDVDGGDIYKGRNNQEKEEGKEYVWQTKDQSGLRGGGTKERKMWRRGSLQDICTLGVGIMQMDHPPLPFHWSLLPRTLGRSSALDRANQLNQASQETKCFSPSLLSNFLITMSPSISWPFCYFALDAIFCPTVQGKPLIVFLFVRMNVNMTMAQSVRTLHYTAEQSETQEGPWHPSEAGFQKSELSPWDHLESRFPPSLDCPRGARPVRRVGNGYSNLAGLSSANTKKSPTPRLTFCT